MHDRRGYREATEQPQLMPIELSHLSIEVGHFSPAEIAGDSGLVRAEFQRIAPLVSGLAESTRLRYGAATRISTCFLIDDYFRPQAVPAEVVPELHAAADAAGLVIDYVAREAGCHRAAVFAGHEPAGEPVKPTEMVAARIVSEPAPPDNGSRPPTADLGWLCNGKRSAAGSPGQAMHTPQEGPPEEFGKREHSIFLDAELWSERVVDGVPERFWSCHFLAAVWHLLRLGMLRYHGTVVAQPQRWSSGQWPEQWSELPPVIQLNPAAAPFAAYRTMSILPRRYLSVEHAVQVILDHLDIDDEVTAQVLRLGRAEGVIVPRQVGTRSAYLFLDEP